MKRIKLYYKDNTNWGKLENFTGIVDWEWKNNNPDPLYHNFPQVEVNYYKDGDLHRLDGPAVIMDNKDCLFYVNGINYSVEEFMTKFVSKLSSKDAFNFFFDLDKYQKEQ